MNFDENAKNDFSAESDEETIPPFFNFPEKSVQSTFDDFAENAESDKNEKTSETEKETKKRFSLFG